MYRFPSVVPRFPVREWFFYGDSEEKKNKGDRKSGKMGREMGGKRQAKQSETVSVSSCFCLVSFFLLLPFLHVAKMHHLRVPLVVKFYLFFIFFYLVRYIKFYQRLGRSRGEQEKG